MYYSHTARQCRANNWKIFLYFSNFKKYSLHSLCNSLLFCTVSRADHSWGQEFLCRFFCIYTGCAGLRCMNWSSISPHPRPLRAFPFGLGNSTASHPRTQTQFTSYSSSIFLLFFQVRFFFFSWMAINFTSRFRTGYVTPPPDSKSITVQRDRIAESLWSSALGFPWGTEKLQC